MLLMLWLLLVQLLEHSLTVLDFVFA